MRIIGGRLKGKLFGTAEGFKARPTTDYAREALFDILDNEYEFEGLKVLDLFGGSGSISFEFSSRGAGHVWCVEMNPKYAATISKEASRLVIDNVTVVRHNVFDFLSICKERFDLIFADPPYDMEGVEGLPDRIVNAGILYPGNYFILEHGEERSFTGHPLFKKEKVYGRVHFSFFELPATD